MASATSSSSGQSSPPLATPPPRPLRRYPSNLSRADNHRSRPSSNKVESSEPHKYQSLEDLLRVNGYQETRVFTPESKNGDGDESIGPNETADSKGGRVGEVVASLLSSWIPGASVASNKLKGPGPTSTEEPFPPQGPSIRIQRSLDQESLLERKAVAKSAPGPQPVLVKTPESQTKYNAGFSLGTKPISSRPPSAYRNHSSKYNGVTPSPSSAIRPSPRQMSQHRSAREPSARLTAQNLQSLAPPRPGHHLRHVNSAPSMGRAQRELRRTQSKLNAQAINPHHEGWLESFANMFAGVNRSNSTTRPTSANRSRSRTSRRNAPPPAPIISYLHPTSSTASVILKTEPVLCRSAPSSRSASRARAGLKSVRDPSRGGAASPESSKLLATPLLSPSLASKEDDPLSSMWTEAAVAHAVNVLQEYQSRSLLDQDSLDLSDPDPPDLRALLSSYTQNQRQACPLDLDSIPTVSLDGDVDDPVARRQRSIRSLQSSLRNHMVHTSTPGVNGIPPLPDLPPKFKLPLSSSPDEIGCGPEWEGCSTARKTKKRALLPWLVPGERRGSADEDTDSWEEPDAGRIRGRR